MKTDGFALLVRNGDLAQNLFFEVEVLEVAPCRQKGRQVKAVFD